MIENGPIPAIHGVVRWRLVDLCQWVFEEFPHSRRPPDDEPGAARHGLPQTFRQATPLCQSRYRRSTLVQSSHGMLSNLWGLP